MVLKSAIDRPPGNLLDYTSVTLSPGDYRRPEKVYPPGVIFQQRNFESVLESETCEFAEDCGSGEQGAQVCIGKLPRKDQ